MSAASSPAPIARTCEFHNISQQVHVVIPVLRALLPIARDPPAADLHPHVRDFFPPSPPPLTPDIESDFSRLSPTPSPDAHDAHNAHDAHDKRVPAIEKARFTFKQRGCTSGRRRQSTSNRVRCHGMLTRWQRKQQRRADSLLELNTSGQASKARYPKKLAR